jgi:hypothetical protein
MQAFLMEVGHGFTVVDSQKRMTVGTSGGVRSHGLPRLRRPGFMRGGRYHPEHSNVVEHRDVARSEHYDA